MGQETLLFSGEFRKHAVILYLPAPPQPRWYSKKIAGVSFLLRNLLTLQKMGVEKLSIWVDESGVNDLNNYIGKIKKDPRLALNWLSRSSSSETTSFLVCDGAILIDEGAVQFSQTNGNIPFSVPGALKQFLSQKEVYFLKPALPEQQERLKSEADFQEAEDRLLKSCGLNNDSFMDRFFARFISRQFTAIFLKTSITPNQITFISLLVGLTAAFCFFWGGYQAGIVGSILLLVSAWVDCADGEIARLKFMATEWGAKLDIIADNIVHCLLFLSIGMGLFHSTGEPVFKYLGMFAASGSLAAFMLLSKTVLRKKAEATDKASTAFLKKDRVGQLANRDFVYFIFALALFGRLDAFIFFAAIGSNFFAAYLAWQKLQANSG